MNLINIAKQILKEDTWGNNPSAAGGMSPGRVPTATTPPPAQSGNVVDISNEFKNFKVELEKQRDTATKKLIEKLNKSFLKKQAKVNASKGSIGQVEKEYDILVTGIDVRHMKDTFYIVFKGKEGKASEAEYYVEDSQITVNPVNPSSPTSQPQSSLKTAGGMVPLKPTSQMAPVAKNILPQG
jgi:hypothetical protein